MAGHGLRVVRPCRNAFLPSASVVCPVDLDYVKTEGLPRLRQAGLVLPAEDSLGLGVLRGGARPAAILPTGGPGAYYYNNEIYKEDGPGGSPWDTTWASVDHPANQGQAEPC